MSDSSAKKSLSSLRKIISNDRIKTQEELIRKLNFQKAKLFSSYPKEPIVKNSVSYVLHGLKKRGIMSLKDELSEKINHALNHISNSESRIAEVAHGKIRRGMGIYVHGYSKTIVELLLRAKSQGINFSVHNTESKPHEDGRILAETLAKKGVKVIQYSDLALRIAIKNADVVLIAAHVISESGQVYANIGAELIADLAEKYDVPVYVCTDSWRLRQDVAHEYNKSKELRPTSELWKNPPKGITILNYGFEKVNPKLITGIITEQGIFKPHYFVSEMKRTSPWVSSK